MGFQHANITQTRTRLHTRTRIIAHTAQTRIRNVHIRTVCSGPHKLDVRLLLLSSQGAVQLGIYLETFMTTELLRDPVCHAGDWEGVGAPARR